MSFPLLIPVATGLAMLGVVAVQPQGTAPATPVPVAQPAETAPALSLTDLDRELFGQMVREYLLEHPQVLIEAMEVMQARETQQAADAARQAIVDNHDQLFNNPVTPATGAENPDVIMVEFFDYNCGYCKRVMGDIMTVIEEDPGVRVVWKEFPILAESSNTAALAALAAHRQGKYLEMHLALMGHQGGLDDATIDRIAGEVGLDVAQMRQDMTDDALAAQLEANRRLASALRVNGTPALVIGEELVPGAIPLEQMRARIAEVRSRQG